MAQKPLVDRLAKNLGDRAAVLRVSIHTQTGNSLAHRYGGYVVPLFIIFAEDGQETWRGSLIPSVETVLGKKEG